MADHPKFIEVVQEVWHEICKGPMKQIWLTLKLLRGKLKMLYTSEFKGFKDKIGFWRNELDKCQ